MKGNIIPQNAKAAALIQVKPINKVLLSKNADKKLPIASITKLMTILIILDGIDGKEIKWRDKVKVSPNAASIYGTKINLKAGEKLFLEDMFKAIIIASANDAAIALAEHYSGNVENFADKMNKKAKELDLRNSNFTNPHGLFERNHYSSAIDIAKIAMEALKREEILRYSRLEYDYIRRENNHLEKLINTNRLIGMKPEVDGLKTGYTPAAGFCLVATALKEDIRLISIVLGEPNKVQRDKETIQILDYGFRVAEA